jgi:hypothetical protein
MHFFDDSFLGNHTGNARSARLRPETGSVKKVESVVGSRKL